MATILCAADREFGAEPVRCDTPAAVLVTIRGALGFNCEQAPRCLSCAAIARRVIEKYCAVSGGTYEDTPIEQPADGAP